MEAEQRYEILQRARLKTLFKRLVLFLLVGTLTYYTVALVYYTKTLYKVRRNYAVILEDLSGERRVIADVGWHWRLYFFLVSVNLSSG